jgi:hypothetical protein
MLLDTSEQNVTGSSSIIGFATEGDGSLTGFDRYLTVEGNKAFHIGNVCGTCSFFFERLEGANQSVDVEAIVGNLNRGITELGPPVIPALALIVPDGTYKVLLQEIHPYLVKPGESADYFANEQVSLWGIDGFWGMPHFPKTEYYRLRTQTLTDSRGLFEFLVPMFPHNWLDQKQLTEYKVSYGKNVMPTAVSISVLDVKQPAMWTEGENITSHWCLAHYLIDGHHKVYAAAQENKPLTLISFLSLDQGVSSEEEINELVATLNDANKT